MGDKTVRIGIDSSAVQSQMRRSAEEFRKLSDDVNRDSSKASETLLKAFAEKARMYTTSAQESLRSIDAQSKDYLEKRKQEREQEKRYIDDVRAGKVEGVSYSKEKYERQVTALRNEEIEDKAVIRGLREIVEAIQVTSRTEILEDRKLVQSRLASSNTVNRLYQQGDDPVRLLSESIQQNEISRLNQQEHLQRSGFNLRGVILMGQQAINGDVGGAMIGGGTRMLATAAANPVTWVIGAILAAVGGSLYTNKKLGENLREYGVSSQMSINDMIDFRKSISGAGYTRFGMTGNDLLKESIPYNKALGGADLTGRDLTGLTAITKSRDISKELLAQTIGFSRYGNDGNLATVITNLEGSIERMYGGDEFKRKLVQLPEMMQVYNSLAAQQLSSTGKVNQSTLSSFIGGIGSTFDVEGQNLQRYSSGIKGMMGNTGNRVVGSIQAQLIREKFPHLSGVDLYQKMLEIQENPTAHNWFMKGTWDRVKKFGGDWGESVNPNFRSWGQQYGFGAGEMREMYGKDLDFNFVKSSQGKTSPDQAFDKFIQAAEKFYSFTEKFEADKKDKVEDISTLWGSVLETGADGKDSLRVKVTNQGQKDINEYFKQNPPSWAYPPAKPK